MSSDIYAKPDLSKKVRYSRNMQEAGEGWEEREVNIYASTEDVVENRVNVRTQEGEPQTQNLPPVHKRLVRCAALCLLLCFLTLAGILSLSIHISLKMNDLISSNSQLQDKLAVMELHSSVANLSKVYSHFEDEMKKQKTKGKWCPDEWITFGRSCYFKSTDSKTWTESRRYCKARGADLVIINSKEEQEFANKLMNTYWYWIGLQRTGDEWKWVDGSPLTFTFWADREPYRYNLGIINNQGKWTTAYSTSTSTWICEK